MCGWVREIDAWWGVHNLSDFCRDERFERRGGPQHLRPPMRFYDELQSCCPVNSTDFMTQPFHESSLSTRQEK